MARGPWPVWLALLPLLAAVAWGQAGGHPDDLDVRAQTALRLGSLGLARLAVEGGYPAIYEPGAAPRRLDAGGQPLPAGAFTLGPEATIAVGAAHLAAYELNGEPACHAAALEVARALAASQLESGGWAEVADPGAWTRAAAQAGEPPAARANESRLSAPLTAAGLRFLRDVVQLTADDTALATAQYGLRGLLQHQRADGAWPAHWPPRASEAGHGVIIDESGAAVTPALLEALLDTPLPGAGEALLEGARQAGEWLLARRGPAGWAPAYDSAGAAVGPADDEAATAAALEALAALALADRADRRWVTAAQEVLAARPARGSLTEAAAARVAAAAAGRTRPADDRESRAWRTRGRSRAVADLLATQAPNGLWLTDGRVHPGHCAANLQLLAEFLTDYEPIPAEFLEPPTRPTPHQR